MEYEFKRSLLVLERKREQEHDYLSYHRRRFKYVLELCKHLVSDTGVSVLDVGRSQLSRQLASYYSYVVTLGFLSGEWGHTDGVEGREPHDHIEFDLNDVVAVERVSDQRRFDLIVLAETIEHLHAAPELVLKVLADLLKSDGLIVCQTPNAAALHKRIKLLFGMHPYERIRIDERNPGHFREYTKIELIDIAKRVGLRTVHHEYVEYFGRPEGGGIGVRVGFAVYLVSSALIPSLRRGQTVVLQLDANSGDGHTGGRS